MSSGKKQEIEELHGRVFLALRSVIAQVILFNHTVAERFGFSASEMQFIHLLQLHGPMPAGRLAQLSGLTTGTVTAIVDRLEAAKYVTREQDPSDRRKVIVRANEGYIGETLAPAYQEQGARVLDALMGRPSSELVVIADFLEKLGARKD